jgi:hypothetical protein
MISSIIRKTSLIGRRPKGSPVGPGQYVSANCRVILLVSVLLLIVAPVHAGTVYLQGSPQLSAYISGINEFSPGDGVNLTIVVKNTGLNALKLVQMLTPSRADLPNTAKFLTIGLTPGDVPVAIKSDPQMVGDVEGGSDASAVFTVKVNPDAPAGNYLLPLQYNYTYLYATSTFDSLEEATDIDSQNYIYQSVNGTLYVPLTIKPVVTVDVLSVSSDSIYVGNYGYLDMKIRNLGSDDGQKAVVRILRNGNSPILPADSDTYLGDFPPGSIADFRYRVFVSPDAQPGIYPVDVEVIYQNTEGDFVTSRIETTGVAVSGKADFSVISDPAVINPGDKKVVTVIYKNTGAVPVYSAQARIIAVYPFTTSDDISPLGDLMPGDSASASFSLTLDRDATIKEYGLDSEIRYRDEINNSYVSDSVPVRIRVTQPSGIAAVLYNPVFLLVAFIIAAVGIFRLTRRRHS